MNIIAIANQKGGVGKTTSVHNLGVAFARYHKKKTLLIDLDPQGNLTDSCGINPNELDVSASDILEGAVELNAATLQLEDGLYLLPSNQSLAGAELNLANRIGRENVLKRILQKQSLYDLVVIDCPPALGLLTINAFVASNHLLIPIQAEYHALAGLAHITNTLREIKESELNQQLSILGVFVTFYDSRKKLNQGVVEALQTEWGSALFATRIRDNVALAEAPSHSQDIFTYKQKSLGSFDYQELAKEILVR